MLQKVSRTESGLYQCHAINQEGEGSSNTVNLPIKCKYSLQHRPLDIGENTLWTSYRTRLKTNDFNLKKSLVKIVVVLMKFLEMQGKYYFLGKARNLQDNSSVQQFYFFTSAFFSSHLYLVLVGQDKCKK